ncbi:MAG: shikimate dehydrogenase, partial [Pseudomonadaceae bacterium]|nr:shikimate dehydrogenase [Pseudomonadaceae bacterium]
QPEAQVTSGNWESLQASQYDLVLNATSSSLAGDLPPLPDDLFTDESLAYDLMYSQQATPFMLWAKAQGATKVADGLGMLVEQAAEAFFLWRQVRPATQPVLKRLRPLEPQ